MPRGVTSHVSKEATPRSRLLGVIGAFAVAGVLAAVIWVWLWTPPTGVAVDGEWFLDADGLQSDVSGTGLYVVVAVTIGVVLGTIAAVTARSQEMVTLAAVALGSVLAAAVMGVLGPALGPPDPRPLATSAEDLTPLPSDLRVEGAVAYAALPAGALTGLAVWFIVIARPVENGFEPEPRG